MKRSIDQFKRALAKRLRANDTRAEEMLWRALRKLDLGDTHFRRQVPIGRYIVDFACLSHHLVVEVDGSQHGDGQVAAYDFQRTRWLEQEGYRVLRFWNNDVLARTDAVLEAIHDMIAATPPRPQDAGDPPPQGEGESVRDDGPRQPQAEGGE